jgi:3-oxoacyl-[acyl-carrier protein] reductase
MLNTDFTDRAVLVSGAAQGIGAAIARGFADAGARVHVADIDEQGLERTAAALGADAHVADLALPEESASVVHRVVEQETRLDILVHAAGGVCGQVGRPIEEIDEDDWREVFEANVDAAFWLAQAVAPVMKREGRGRIVFISSGAGLRPSLTGIQAYTAAKHALVGLTKQLSWELGPFGITVNSVAPGLVLSNPSSVRQWESYPAKRQRAIVESTHTRRLGQPGDIAAAVLFLASDSASWISGQVLSVDGGRS